MSDRAPITDAELQAYVDQQLPVERQQQVEDYLQHHPAAAAKVAAYQQLNLAITELYDPIAQQPIPDRLLDIRPDYRQPWRAAAAIFVWLTLGGVIGWFAHTPFGDDNDPNQLLTLDLSQPAALAHSLFSPEKRHPVEVPASEQAHLQAWLSKRLDTPVQAPDLSAQGYQLLGGRLLPSSNGKAAQFMYQHAGGQRLTLYLRPGDWPNAHLSMRTAHMNNLNTYYWTRDAIGYAVTADLPLDTLQPMARNAHDQLAMLSHPAASPIQ